MDLTGLQMQARFLFNLAVYPDPLARSAVRIGHEGLQPLILRFLKADGQVAAP